MNVLDPITAVLWTQRILGAGLLIQSTELLITRRLYAADGALAGRAVTAGLVARLVLAGLLVLSSFAPLLIFNVSIQAALLANTLWLTIRSRGPVCGGSDSMFFQVQLGLLLGSFGPLQPLCLKLGLGWIAAQSVLSYFLAGLAKFKNSGWWNGRALQNLFASPGPYLLFAPARRLRNSTALCLVLGLAVVWFELIFPLVLVAPTEAKLMLLTGALIFHLANALLLGLNRFLWAWAATYPALLAF